MATTSNVFSLTADESPAVAPSNLIRRVLDRVSHKGPDGSTLKPTSRDFERFRRGRRDLGNTYWVAAADGGTMQDKPGSEFESGPIVLRFQLSFMRRPHWFELSPTEIAWEVDGDGGLESVGGFPGKGGAALPPKKRSTSNKGKPPRPDLVQGVLVLAWRFYCKVQTPGAQLGKSRLTFDETLEANSSLSFLGLLSFLRDFDVVPQLLLPEDVGALWRMHLAQGRHDRGRVVGDQVPPPRIRSEDVAQSSLDLTEFTHFLVKVALVAFADRIDRAALKFDSKAITSHWGQANPNYGVQGPAASVHSEDTSNSTMADADDNTTSSGKNGMAPQPRAAAATEKEAAVTAAVTKAVTRLGAYLRLHDDNWCRHVLATRGSATCTRINNPKASAGEGFGAENRAISLREAKARASVGERHRQEAANLRQQRAQEWALHEQSQQPHEEHRHYGETEPSTARVTKRATSRARPQSAGNARKQGHLKPPWQSVGMVERARCTAQDKPGGGSGLMKKAAFKSKRAAIEPAAKGGADDTDEHKVGKANHGRSKEVEVVEAASRPWQPGQPAMPRPWERPHSGGNAQGGGGDGVVWVAGAEGSKEWGKLYSKLSDQTLISQRRSANRSSEEEKSLVGLDRELWSHRLLDTQCAALRRYRPSLASSLVPFVFEPKRQWLDLVVPALDLGLLHEGAVYPFEMAVKNTFGADAISAHIQHIRGSALRELTTTTFVAAVGIAPGLTHGCVVELDLRRPALRAASAAAAKSAQIKASAKAAKAQGASAFASGLFGQAREERRQEARAQSPMASEASAVTSPSPPPGIEGHNLPSNAAATASADTATNANASTPAKPPEVGEASAPASPASPSTNGASTAAVGMGAAAAKAARQRAADQRAQAAASAAAAKVAARAAAKTAEGRGGAGLAAVRGSAGTVVEVSGFLELHVRRLAHSIERQQVIAKHQQQFPQHSEAKNRKGSGDEAVSESGSAGAGTAAASVEPATGMVVYSLPIYFQVQLSGAL